MLLKLQLHRTQLHHQRIQEELIQALLPLQLRSQVLLTLLKHIQGRLHQPIRLQDKAIREQPLQQLDKLIQELPRLLDTTIQEPPLLLLDRPIRERHLLLLLRVKAIREPLLLLQDKAIQEQPPLLKAIQEVLLPILELLEDSLILLLPLEILTAADASQDTPIQHSLTTEERGTYKSALRDK